VLNTQQAVEMSVVVVRTFIRLRQLAQSHEDLWRKVTALEKKYDKHFRSVFDAIRELMEKPAPAKRPMGFMPPPTTDKSGKSR
jgi:hypothetical protein